MEITEILKALAVETRLRILLLLKEHPLCVNAMARRLGVTQSAVSQHLRVLRAARLVRDHREGAFVHYSLNEEVVDRFREEIDRLLR